MVTWCELCRGHFSVISLVSFLPLLGKVVVHFTFITIIACSSSCENGGTCGTNGVCYCPSGYGGSHCQISSSSSSGE